MQRLAPYLGIVIIVVLGSFIIALSSFVNTLPSTPTVVRPATSTLAVVPNVSPPSSGFETKIATTSQSVLVPKKDILPTPKPTSKTPTIALSPQKSVPVSVPTTPIFDTNALFDASASLLRAALVNVICYAPSGTRLQSISGSGIIINPKGIILTNAHIAQYFLLTDRNVSCKIRSGSPASDSYEASLIYLPSAWINANASVLTEQNPSGTGEYDFAFLAVTKSISRNALPESFPFISLSISPPNIGTPIIIASYGAQFLEYNQIQSSLFPTVVFGSVKDIFTFASTTIDVISLGGSAAAQEGSSGGGISNINGELVGTITTSTIKGATDTRTLSAITTSYIRAEYANETGNALDLLLTESTSTAITNFAPKMPALESILTANLP